MLEATCNSRRARALILVQNIVTFVPRVLLRARRRHMRCGGGGVNMPSFSEAQASIALMWICGAPTVDQSKSHSLYFKACIHQTPDCPPHGAATRILIFIGRSNNQRKKLDKANTNIRG